MVADLGLSAAIVPVAVLALGLPGAPLGQGICQLVMLALVWRALVRQRARWHLGEPGPAAGLWRGERWRELIAVGLPPQLARIAMFAAYAIVVQHVAEDGPAAVAGYGIAFLVLSSAITVGSAVGRAVAIVLGQSVGAGDRARAARAARAGLVAAVAVGAGLGLALAALAGPLVGILAPTPAIAEPAARALRGMALALPLLGIAQVLLFAVTALKAAKRVSLLSAAADAVTVAIALAWPGASHLDGAIWAICAGSAVRALALGLAGRAIIARALAALPRPGGST
jgi:Na+-driven multidrug efflux pump